VGLAGAALSALVGGWLGFHTPADPLLAVVTTIARAAAATNLALILVSVAASAPRGLSQPPGGRWSAPGRAVDHASQRRSPD
jgi:hypothetical protein